MIKSAFSGSMFALQSRLKGCTQSKPELPADKKTKNTRSIKNTLLSTNNFKPQTIFQTIKKLTKMKKLFVLPALGILSVALFSFKSASTSEGRIIHCDDGTTIVPSSVPMTIEDQNAIVSIISEYGDDAGYAVYTTPSGEVRVYNPTPVEVLADVDARYGSDLASGASLAIWISKKETENPDKSFTKYKHVGSDLTMAIHARVAPILAKYE